MDLWRPGMLQAPGGPSPLHEGGTALVPGFAEEMAGIHSTRIAAFGRDPQQADTIASDVLTRYPRCSRGPTLEGGFACEAAGMRLPPRVAAPLLAARRVEAAARGVQRDAARLATGRLMAAVQAAGWTTGDIGQAVGLTPSAVSYRIRAARRRGGGGGLAVPARVPDSSGPRVDELDWLTAAQARDLLGVHRTTLHRWRQAGLLPNSRLAETTFRYSRADLLGILRRRGGRKILPTGARKSIPVDVARPIGVWPRRNHPTASTDGARDAGGATVATASRCYDTASGRPGGVRTG